MASINFAPNSHSYMIQNNGHAKAVQTKFCSLLEKSSLVDVDIICGDRLIRAHKCLLAANSPYFKEEFQKDRSIVGFIVNGMDYCDVFKLMMLLYTGEASIHGKSLKYILKASQVFKIKWIQLLLTDKSYKIDPDIQIPLPLFFNKHSDLSPFYVTVLKFPNLKPKSKFDRKTAQGSRSVLKPPNERFNNPARSAAVLKELSGKQNEFVSNLIIPKTADSSSNCTIVRENPGQGTAGEEITQPTRPVVKSTYERFMNPVRTAVVVQDVGQKQGNPGQKNAVEDVNQIPTSILKTTENCKNPSVAIEEMDVDQDEFISNLMRQVSTDNDCANFTSFIRNIGAMEYPVESVIENAAQTCSIGFKNLYECFEDPIVVEKLDQKQDEIIGQDAIENCFESVIENLGKENSENTSAISNLSEGNVVNASCNNAAQICSIGFKNLYECFEDPIVIEKLDQKQDAIENLVESLIENLGKNNYENTLTISNMSEGNTTPACNIGFKHLHECFEDPIDIEKFYQKQDEILSDLTVQVPFNVDDFANCTSVKSNLGQQQEMNLFNGYDRDVDFQLSLDEVMPLTNDIFPVCDNVFNGYDRDVDFQLSLDEVVPLTNDIFPVCDNVIEKYLNDDGPSEPMEQEPFDDIPCDVLIDETLVDFILGPEEA